MKSNATESIGIKFIDFTEKKKHPRLLDYVNEEDIKFVIYHFTGGIMTQEDFIHYMQTGKKSTNDKA